MRLPLPLVLVLFGFTAPALVGCNCCDTPVSTSAVAAEKEAKTAAPASRNWSFWRGPEQTGVSRERDLPEKFSADPKAKDSNVLWVAPYGGITTPIVQDGRVYLINKVGEGEKLQERVMAFDADTGKKLWEHAFNVFHTDIVEDRLGWTHLVGDPETGNVYAHGTQGFFFCFNKDGKVLWQRSLTEEFGRVSGYGGRLTSAIVDEDLVILSMVNASWGEQTIGGTRFVAFDKKKGHVVWWGSGGHRVADTYYSSPVVAVIGGQRLVLSGGGDGCVHAFKVRTGEKAWSYKFGDGAVNCSPVVLGDKVFIGHGEENEDETQGRVVCVDGGKVTKGEPKLVWKVDGIKVKFAAPLLHEGRLYVCDETGKMYCLDAATGKQLWDYTYGKNTKGSPVWADGKIYLSEVDSRFHILQLNKDGCKPLSRVFFRSTSVAPVELHGSPAIVNGRIYFMTDRALYCVGKKGHTAAPSKAPAPVKEEPAAKDAKPAHVQVVPADVTVRPGESAAFRARTFDDRGRLLGEAKAIWTLSSMRPPAFPVGMTAPKTTGKPLAPPTLGGTLTAKAAASSTEFTASKDLNGQFGRVVAKVGSLEGDARVRVAPVVPYLLDFSTTKIPDGRTPPGWVNTMGKFAVKTLKDGTKVLSKRNDTASPLVARANAYIGAPDLHGYTVEADVYGTKVRTDMPDVGVGANRYTLLLAGNDQELRLGAWDAQHRVEKVQKFAWKPNVWYTMKVTVAVDGGKATARGKVWPRGEAEPKDWTITVDDPMPNPEGSPTLYGFSTGIVDAESPGSEIYYGRVKITPNK